MRKLTFGLISCQWLYKQQITEQYSDQGLDDSKVHVLRNCPNHQAVKTHLYASEAFLCLYLEKDLACLWLSDISHRVLSLVNQMSMSCPALCFHFLITTLLPQQLFELQSLTHSIYTPVKHSNFLALSCHFLLSLFSSTLSSTYVQPACIRPAIKIHPAASHLVEQTVPAISTSRLRVYHRTKPTALSLWESTVTWSFKMSTLSTFVLSLGKRVL